MDPDQAPAWCVSLEAPKGALPAASDAAASSAVTRSRAGLAEARAFGNALDMGCGSGILAFATAKLWSGPVRG